MSIFLFPKLFFIFYVRLNYSNTQNPHMIIYQIGNFWNFDSFPNWIISEIQLFYEFVNNVNFMTFEIVKLTNY